MSDAELKETLDIFAKVAGEHLMWAQAAGLIESFYFTWMNRLGEMEALAEEQGKLPCKLFADVMVEGLKKHFQETSDGSEEVR